MPEYLAPGVFIEELGSAARPIDGADTSTCGFAGPTLRGPTGGSPELLGSMQDFERIYGGLEDLPFGPNYLAHSARAFFENGGKRLYVARTAAGRGNGLAAPDLAPDCAAYKAALGLLQNVEEISIVAAPGYSASPEYAGIQQALIDCVEAANAFRIAVLDARPGQSPADVRRLHNTLNCRAAALYYPWVMVEKPSATGTDKDQRGQLALPPSGFVCGIYARTDISSGVPTAPTNQEVRGALRLARNSTRASQESLTSLGVNCLVRLPGGGLAVSGARTTSTDPEWRYINVRRLLNHLEASLYRGTQWVVFEPNDEALWAKVRASVGDFLLGFWQSGALVGTRPEQAYFVRCDRSTMTQNDLDNGRLVCLIGVATAKPAEFSIFRLGQQTAGP